MISVMIDAALRSLFVGLIVAVGLRAFRIRNVFAQKAALGLVLAGALAMPLLMPIMDRFGFLPASASIVLPARPMTLLEELQAKLLAKSGSGNVVKPAEAPVPASDPAQTEESSGSSPDRASAPRAKESGPPSTRAAAAKPKAAIGSSRAAEEIQPLSRPRRVAFSPALLAISVYLGIAAVLLLRLAFGLVATLRLWFNAVPVSSPNLSETSMWLRVRASDSVPSPLTVGSAVLLPADFETWDKEKFRIVLAHERSHVRQGDFYLQLLAGLYAALVWFSPLGWWLKKELADLSEAISDRAGIEEARSRASYAQILLEFAVAPRPTALGVAMARSGSLTRRIERLLNEQAFRQSFTGVRQRAIFAVVLVPMALFAATALVRVQAATQSARVAWIAPATSPAARPALEPEMAYPAEQFDSESVEAGNLAIATTPDVSASAAVAPETETPPIAASELATAQAAPNLFQVPAIARAIAAQSESGSSTSFDRTLTVSGEAQLIVSTGSGNIHLTRGSGNQIRIHGQIHLSHEGSEGQAREIAANPPIEQTGDVIRVGQQHGQHSRGISINYQIEAPAGTLLEVTSGSGDIVDEGVGKNAKLETGSGNISANGLQGAFVVKTGSGDITAQQTGQGDVKAETGSGNVEIKEIHGSFSGKTGSGDIKATGTPSAPWTLETGSGNVELWAGNAPLTLDASTGSGSVNTDHEMLVKGSLNHHHITGNLNGGGPLVHVQTGSGDISVH
jgi:beta-lactamase regulating signal transducer with metallopeptidase domain